jgi:hypothetical protein
MGEYWNRVHQSADRRYSRVGTANRSYPSAKRCQAETVDCNMGRVRTQSRGRQSAKQPGGDWKSPPPVGRNTWWGLNVTATSPPNRRYSRVGTERYRHLQLADHRDSRVWTEPQRHQSADQRNSQVGNQTSPPSLGRSQEQPVRDWQLQQAVGRSKKQTLGD